MSASIVYLGAFGGNSTCRMRAAAMQRLGCQVTILDPTSSVATSRVARVVNRLTGHVLQKRAVGVALTKAVRDIQPNVIWCDKSVFLTASALMAARSLTDALIIHYNPDDPFGRAPGVWNTFVSAIPYYDVHLVPRPVNGPEYCARGARHVIAFDRGFCPDAHRAPNRAHARWKEFAVPVAFTGSYELERSRALAGLVKGGIPLAIRGSYWRKSRDWALLRARYRGGEVGGEEYRLALGAPQITLHFLRRANRDEQDSRTFEIPACGGFMMAEWSRRHSELFEEGVEAVFFRSESELYEKVQYYLARPEECAAIAARGRARAHRSGYDYDSRVHELLIQACRTVGRDDLLRLLPPRTTRSPKRI